MTTLKNTEAREKFVGPDLKRQGCRARTPARGLFFWRGTCARAARAEDPVSARRYVRRSPENYNDELVRMILRALRCRSFRGASAGQYVDDSVVAFAAGVFKHGSINVAQGNNRGPGLRPSSRVVNRELILDRLGIEPRETLGDFQGLRVGVLKRGASPEIGGLHNQRVALPMPPRIAVPAVDASREMRTAI